MGNLSFEATEKSLFQLFEDNNVPVVTLNIVYDRESGYSKGFAFATVKGDGSAALKLNGASFYGRYLKVNIAT